MLLAPLLGLAPDQLTPGQMTYHLRRLRLHGLIQRIPSTHRYEITAIGHRMALFCTRVYNRVLRPGLSQIAPGAVPGEAGLLQKRYAQLEVTLDDWIANAALAS